MTAVTVSAVTYAPVVAAVGHTQEDGTSEHFITLEGTSYYDELDKWQTSHYFELAIAGSRTTYSLYYYGPAGVARNQNGPGRDATGPLAYLIEQAVCLSAERPAVETVTHQVAIGDTLVLRGERFRLLASQGYRATPELDYLGDR